MTERPNLQNASSVLDNWNANHGPLWQIRPSDLFWNLREQNWVLYETADLAGVPAIVGTATAEGVKNGLATKSLWLALWSQIPTGQEKKFVEALVELAKNRNKSRVSFGADEFHFLPGIPLEETENTEYQGLKAAVQACGFTGSEVVDFVGTLAQPKIDDYISKALAEEKQWAFLPLAKQTEEELSLFLNSEFPGRWSREFQFWRNREDTRRAQWYLLRPSKKSLHKLNSADESIVGFARLAIRGNQKPLDHGWSPGALRLSFGSAVSATDGCLGPIGVAKSQRGHGAGRILLAYVLRELKQQGAKEICIDWTDAIRFYSELNLSLARKYWTAWKSGSL